jgi:hypothetical protein
METSSSNDAFIMGQDLLVLRQLNSAVCNRTIAALAADNYLNELKINQKQLITVLYA